MGFNPAWFWGASGQTVFPLVNQCDDIFYQFYWQKETQVSREEITNAIKEAEEDENLSDFDILYCLRPSWIAEVMNQKLRDEFGFEPDLEKLEPRQYPIYEKEIRHMAEVIDLLNWLLEVPISIREQV